MHPSASQIRRNVKPLAAALIALSTIGIGQDIDANLMSLLARGGLGRYYFTDRVREVPRIMLRETNVVTRPVAMEGRVQPRLGATSQAWTGAWCGTSMVMSVIVTSADRSLCAGRGAPTEGIAPVVVRASAGTSATSTARAGRRRRVNSFISDDLHQLLAGF